MQRRSFGICACAPATASSTPACSWWITTPSSRRNVPAFAKGKGSCLIAGSAYRDHKKTKTKVERANGVISDTLCAFANGSKDDWDRQVPLAVFAINKAASTLGDGHTPFLIDQGAHPRLPLSAPPVAGAGGEAPALYATRRKRAMELTVREFLAAAQQERKAKLDASRVDTLFKVGDRALLRTEEPLSTPALDAGKTGRVVEPLSTPRISASCGRGGMAPPQSRRARAPRPTRSRSPRRGCSAADRST